MSFFSFLFLFVDLEKKRKNNQCRVIKSFSISLFSLRTYLVQKKGSKVVEEEERDVDLRINHFLRGE